MLNFGIMVYYVEYTKNKREHVWMAVMGRHVAHVAAESQNWTSQPVAKRELN